jgi:hypothetical protein
MRRLLASLAAAFGVGVSILLLFLGVERPARAQAGAVTLFVVALNDPGNPVSFSSDRRVTVQYVSGRCTVPSGQLLRVVLQVRNHPQPAIRTTGITSSCPSSAPQMAA